MEVLQGTIERIVFENPENGYVIARLDSRSSPGELITIVGNLASINPGESVALKGLWIKRALPNYVWIKESMRDMRERLQIQ